MEVRVRRLLTVALAVCAGLDAFVKSLTSHPYAKVSLTMSYLRQRLEIIKTDFIVSDRAT